MARRLFWQCHEARNSEFVNGADNCMLRHPGTSTSTSRRPGCHVRSGNRRAAPAMIKAEGSASGPNLQRPVPFQKHRQAAGARSGSAGSGSSPDGRQLRARLNTSTAVCQGAAAFFVLGYRTYQPLAKQGHSALSTGSSVTAMRALGEGRPSLRVSVTSGW